MEDLSAVWPFSDVTTDAISIYEDAEVYLDDYSAASPTMQVLFAAYWFQAEVLNGGLAQFFANDTGVLAPEAVDACQKLQLPMLASKLSHAMTWFGTPYPRDRDIRESALERARGADDESPSPFEALDAEVSELIYDEGPGLERAAIEFVKSHGS
jgi:Domain of unknown function (DUF4375)